MSESPGTDESTAVLATESINLAVAGRALDLRPITLAEVPAFSRAARPVFTLLKDMDGETGDTSLFDLIEFHTDELAALIALGARVEPAWLLGLPLEDVARIGEAVVAANRDFFIRRLLPLLGTLRQAGAARTGATPSSASSAPDSDTPT